MTPFALVIALMAGAIVVGTRVNERFRVRIRDGRIVDVRGHVPGVLLEQLADLARNARIERGTIRAVRHFRGSRLIVSGVDERVAQGIRNLVGVHGR
jgi:hypothetical protein